MLVAEAVVLEQHRVLVVMAVAVLAHQQELLLLEQLIAVVVVVHLQILLQLVRVRLVALAL
jgi:hypothetical protein